MKLSHSLLFAPLLIHASARGQCQQQLESVPGFTYGTPSLALDGSTLMVGYQNSATSEGAVDVFLQGTGPWFRAQTLMASDSAPGDGFGQAVDLEGDLAVVSSRSADGSIYVFVRHPAGGPFLELQKIDTAPTAGFLQDDVALRGDWIAVSGKSSAAGNHQATHLFERTSSGLFQWSQTLMPPPGAFDFGFQPAFVGEGSLAVRSAWPMPKIHFYTEVQGTWSFQEQLPITDMYLLDHHAFAFTGGTLVMRGWDAPDGTVRVLERGTNGWVPAGRPLLPFQPHSGTSTPAFGSALAAGERRIAVGSPFLELSGASVQGKPGGVSLFTEVEGQWLPGDFLTLPGEIERLGEGVAIQGGTVVASGREGKFVLYQTIEGVEGYCVCSEASRGTESPRTGCRNSTGRGARLEGCGSTQLSSDDLILSASGMPVGGTSVALFGKAIAPLPFGTGQLCIGGPAQRLAPIAVDASGQVQVGPGLASILGVQPAVTMAFQVMYRDGSTVNLSSAVQVTFAP